MPGWRSVCSPRWGLGTVMAGTAAFSPSPAAWPFRSPGWPGTSSTVERPPSWLRGFLDTDDPDGSHRGIPSGTTPAAGNVPRWRPTARQTRCDHSVQRSSGTPPSSTGPWASPAPTAGLQSARHSHGVPHRRWEAPRQEPSCGSIIDSRFMAPAPRPGVPKPIVYGTSPSVVTTSPPQLRRATCSAGSRAPTYRSAPALSY